MLPYHYFSHFTHNECVIALYHEIPKSQLGVLQVRKAKRSTLGPVPGPEREGPDRVQDAGRNIC